MYPFSHWIHTLFLVGTLLLVGNTGTVHAGPPTRSAPSPAMVVIAERVSWHGFVRFWRNFAHRTDRIVLIVGLVAATALFIITRGKWLK
jgi:hypothetical protein